MTIRDVARLAEVHPGTVSRALNEQTRDLVNQDTAARVLRAARQLGYQPNPMARGLKTNRSLTVGVLVPDLTNPIFPPILRGIEDRLDEAGYTAMIVNTDNDAVHERRQLEALLARQVDGLIAATARRDGGELAAIAAAGRPVVLVNRSLEGDAPPAVTVDDRRGSHLAVDHVVELGHTRIAHVGGPQNLSTGHRRHLGFVEALHQHGLEAPRKRISFAAAFSEVEGERACGEVLDAATGVTAIVAANDLLAIGCYDALERRGLRCPADVSIVGFNDMPFIDRLRPPLTSVRIPQREIGAVAAGLLLRQLAGEAGTERDILLAPSLIVRGSTGPPPSGG